MTYKQFDVGNETLFLVEVSRHAYDFDNWITGMIFFKRKECGYERSGFFYLPSYMANFRKVIIGKISELNLEDMTFSGISLKEILKDFDPKENRDYLILKKIENANLRNPS